MKLLVTGSNIHQEILIAALLVVMILLLIAAMVILRAMRVILRVAMPGLEAEERAEAARARISRKEKRSQFWNRVMGLRPISEEKDLLIDHEYDGIKELDNPTPVWFMGLFYATIAFGTVYFSVYHVFGWGMDQHQEYTAEMAHAETERKAFLARAANNVDESNVEEKQDEATIAAGRAIFTQNCAVCHGAAGEGLIGPNLTDDYWLHGGDIQQVFKTVKYGVSDKGMVPWEQSLSPAQIAEVSNYIISIRGTNPPNPKEQQGIKEGY